MIDTVLKLAWGACIVGALAGLGTLAARGAGYVGAERVPLKPVTTVRTFSAHAGGRHFRCIEVIDHAAGLRSLGC